MYSANTICTGDDAQNPAYIQTVPRRGYRFIAHVEEKSSRPDNEIALSVTDGFGRLTRRWWRVASALLLALLTLLTLWYLQSSSNESPSPVEDLADKNLSVAVLPVDNLSGDSTLDWLRLGLAEMLVTNLSLSTNLQVVPMEQIHRFIENSDATDGNRTAMELVETLVHETSVDAVLLCSFLKSGSKIRLNTRLQDAETGETLWTDKAEATDLDIFPMVDGLTLRIREELEAPSTAMGYMDLQLADVTTSSLEAYQYYSEGRNLHLEGEFPGAILLYDKAVQLDPDFALAHGKLSAAHGHLRHYAKAEAHGRKALENAERLTMLERYSVEGEYYSLREDTYNRAIDAYRRAVRHDARFFPAQNNLGATYLALERYDEALVHLENCQRLGVRYGGTYRLISHAYQAMGYSDKACRILRNFVEQQPNSVYGYRNLGDALTVAGRLDEAWFFLRRAQSLASGDFRVLQGQWSILALRDRWLEADELAREMASSNDPSIRSRAMRMLATSRLHHGQHGMALEHLDRAVRAHPSPGYSASVIYNIVAGAQLAKGNAAQALPLAEQARKEGKGHFPEWEGLFYSAFAQAKLGRTDEARKTAEDLRSRTAALPTSKETRRYHHLLGMLALVEGDSLRAIEELERAVSMLPARGLHYYPRVEHPNHVPIWCALGRAYMEEGDAGHALIWFRRVSEAGTERLWWPVQYVRSFYFLGKICQQQGDMEKAREHYRRFYEYWKDGDLDRDRVEEARRFLGST